MLAEARRQLHASHTASLDAQLLLGHVLDKPRSWILAHPDAGLDTDTYGSFAALVARRVEGVPVAYLRGWVEWFGLRLEVTPDVLVPRPETELLVEHAAEIAESRGARVLVDIGTGSGAIAIALARLLPAARVIATDVSSAALKVASRNVRRLSPDRVALYETSLLQALPEKPDLIVANLPYLSDRMMRELDRDVRHEPPPALYGGPTGLELYERLIAQAERQETRPSAVFEIDPRQAERARQLWGNRGLRLLDDYSGRPRIAILETS